MSELPNDQIDREIDEIDRQIDERDALMSDNKHFQKMQKFLDGYPKIDEKINNREWLDDEELKLLELDKDVIEDYLGAKRVMEEFDSKSDLHRTADYLAKQNQELEEQNRKVEILYKEKKVNAQLDEVLEIYNTKISDLFKLGFKSYTVKRYSEAVSNYTGNSQEDLGRFFMLNDSYHESEFMRKRDINKDLAKIKAKILQSPLSIDQIQEQLKILEQRIIDNYDKIIQERDNYELQKQQGKDRARRLREDSKFISKLRKFFKG